MNSDAQKAFEDHLSTCDQCKRASSHRKACDKGKALHEAMVREAHDRFKAEGGDQQLRRMLALVPARIEPPTAAHLAVAAGEEFADISVWQGVVNFDAYDRSVISMKATEGVGFQDPQFARNASEANRTGRQKIVYGFLREDLGNTPEAEADWLWAVAAPYMRPGDLLEADAEMGWPSQDWLNRYVAHLQQHAGAGTYSGAWFMSPRGLSYVGFSHVAAYGNVAPAADLWQRTDAGSVPGIAGGVDLNRVLNASIFGAAPGPAPAPAPAPAPPVPLGGGSMSIAAQHHSDRRDWFYVGVDGQVYRTDYVGIFNDLVGKGASQVLPGVSLYEDSIQCEWSNDDRWLRVIGLSRVADADGKHYFYVNEFDAQKTGSGVTHVSGVSVPGKVWRDAQWLNWDDLAPVGQTCAAGTGVTYIEAKLVNGVWYDRIEGGANSWALSDADVDTGNTSPDHFAPPVDPWSGWTKLAHHWSDPKFITGS